MATKSQLAVIHILKKEYDLSDNEYADLMWNLFDETSSKHLDEEQAAEIRDYYINGGMYETDCI